MAPHRRILTKRAATLSLHVEDKRTIDDRFELERLAGAGAMGSVYRAWDRKLGKVVALKLVHDPADAPRFDREANTLESIEHAGIVRYQAHGRSQRNEAYIAMEWLEGETLSSRLDRGPLSIEESLMLGSAVAHALSAAHTAGIVHRDLKPGNILLVGGSIDRPKLVDFGIAHSGDASGETQTGEWIGTPGYMPPEQIRAGGRATPASDVYALGSILFRAVSGRLPYEGETSVEILQKAARQDAPKLRELVANTPPAVEELVAQMLSRDVERRPPDGATAAARLDALASRRQESPSLARAAAASRGRRTRGIGLGVATAILLFGAALFLLARARRDRSPELPKQDMRAMTSAEDRPAARCEVEGKTYDLCTPLPDGFSSDLVAMMGPLGTAARRVEPTASLTGLSARCDNATNNVLCSAPYEVRLRYRYRRGDGLLGSLSASVRPGLIVFERNAQEPGPAVLEPPVCNADALLAKAQASSRFEHSPLEVEYSRVERLDLWQVRSGRSVIRLDAARCAVID